MDRYLQNRSCGVEDKTPTKVEKEAFMKDVRLFRTSNGGIIAAVPRASGTLEPMGYSGRTIYTIVKPSSFPSWSDDSIYAFAGDSCRLAVSRGNYNAHRDSYAQGFNAQALFATEESQGYWIAKEDHRSLGYTPPSGRTTPELCSSPGLFPDMLEEIEMSELELEAIFHQFIDMSQCEGS